MPKLNSPTVRIGLRIALPALAILAGTIAIVTVSLNRMAGEVNEVARMLTMRSANAAVQSALRRIEVAHQDYADWDDAVRNLYGKISQAFFTENFDDATEWTILFDTAYVLDEDGTLLEGTRQGERVQLPVDEAFSPSIEFLLNGLPDDGRTYEAHSGIVSGAWGLALVAVGPIVPSSAELEPPNRSRYLVISKSLDDAALKLFAEEFVLTGLRFVQPGEQVEDELDLVDPGGQTIARLTWASPMMGTTAYAQISPVVIVMLSLIGVTIIALILVAYRSVVEIKRREDQAQYDAAHDALTGLPNRVELLRQVANTIADVPGEGAHAALIFLDLDGFKKVNDVYGHDIGDRLLRHMADEFKVICDNRLVARIGGDEFAILLLDDQPLEAAMALGHRVIQRLTQPIEIDGRSISVGTSLGVAVIDESVHSAEEALRRADIAMYEAKQEGRDHICAYQASFDVARHDRMATAAELRQALLSKALNVIYQPIFDAATRRIVGAEALLRWPRPGKPSICPQVFVPIAEEHGLIDELGMWALRQACATAVAWPEIYIAVNVSPAQLRNQEFGQALSDVLDELGFPPARLELEVTETYLITSPAQAQQSLDVLRDLNVTIALDDFGSGFSSIGYLRSFTFDKLKLDRSLIAGIATDRHAQRFVRATIAMADTLGLQVVAEGVETEEEASLLQLAGCHEFQGFYLGRPCSAEEFTALLQANGEALVEEDAAG